MAGEEIHKYPEYSYAEWLNTILNSYRGNGGGGHLTEGAGIKNNELRYRLVSSTDMDLRYYLLKSVEAKRTINPVPFNNWKIVRDKWVE